jgi:hypothetical protein
VKSIKRERGENPKDHETESTAGKQHKQKIHYGSLIAQIIFSETKNLQTHNTEMYIVNGYPK